MKKKKMPPFMIIPSHIAHDNVLSPAARLMYGDIVLLTHDRSYCWMQNTTFASMYGISKASVTRYVGELRERGYITVEINKAKGNQRLIRIADPRINIADTPRSNNDDTSTQIQNDPASKTDDTSTENSNDPLSTDAEHNNKKVITRTNKDKLNEITEGRTDGRMDLTTTKNPEETNEESDINDQNDRAAPRPPTLDGKINCYKWELRKKLLEERKRFHEMSPDEKAHVVMGFYFALEKQCAYPDEEYKTLRTCLMKWADPELFLKAIWKLYHSSFANDIEKMNGKVWDLNYLCEKNRFKKALINYNFDKEVGQELALVEDYEYLIYGGLQDAPDA